MKTIKKILLIFPLAFCAAMQFGAVAQDYGVPTQVCGNGHYLLRVDNSERYVLLPLEDAATASQIRILADTELDRTIDVRLAKDHVDYYMPLDLAPYQGKNVILDVRSREEADLETALKAVWLSEIRQSRFFDTTNTEKYRPSYHHTPLYGWMNDPNGMFYKDGEWHLFFQYGPYGSTWNNMTWGHSVSADLLHWTNLENAIYTNGLGSIFSGSSVVDKDGSAGFGKDAVISIYTQADRSQKQSMSYSTDGGRTLTTYPKNPVLVTQYEARDPHVFRYEPTGKWIMVLASAPAKEMEIYSSSDLIDWTLESRFGKGYGCQDGVWECPDLMELNIRGTDSKHWVMICNINPGSPIGGSATQYFTGTFDGHEFVCDTGPEVTKWMDWGKDLYATVSWDNEPDGRNTVIGWMSNWQYADVVPTKQYRSADSLPRDVDLFRGDDGELYLASVPVPEIDNAHGRSVNFGSVSLSSKAQSWTIPEDVRSAYELDIELDAGSAQEIEIELSNDAVEAVVMTYNVAASTFAMDRSKSGITDFSPDFPCTMVAPCPKGRTLSLRLFFDHSGIEVFEADGRFVMTNLVFPTEPYNTLSIRSEGGRAKVRESKLYEIK